MVPFCFLATLFFFIRDHSSIHQCKFKYFKKSGTLDLFWYFLSNDKTTPCVTAKLLNCLCSLSFETCCLADVLPSLASPAVLSFQSAGLWKTKEYQSLRVPDTFTHYKAAHWPSQPVKKSWPVDWPPGEMSVTQSPPSLKDYTVQKMKWRGRSMPPFSSAPSMWVNTGTTKPCFVAESCQEKHMCFH